MSRQGSLAVTGLVCAYVCGLAAGSAWARTKTKGKVKDAIYTSPAGNFSVPLPKELIGLHVSDAYEPKEGIGAVSFNSDFGAQLGIHFMRIPKEAAGGLDNATARKQALEGFLEKAALPTWFLPVSKESRILKQELMPFDGVDAVVGLVSVPGGSPLTLVDSKGATRHPDSTRGVLAVFHQDYVYLLTIEVGGNAFAPGAEAPNREDQIATARERLTRFHATIRFEASRP